MICLGLGLAAVSFTACGDWIEPENNGIAGPSFPGDSPEVYARYLAALRNYKSSEHLIAFGWFDNRVKQPQSRAQHLASVPDSMDIVSLLHPADLADWEVEEMDELREKGTKVIFTFSYADILAAYQATLPPVPEQDVEIREGEGSENDGFLAFLSRETDAYLSLVDKYGYDGVSVFYEPLPLDYMQPVDKALESARQGLFVSKLSAWRQTHAGKLFIFEGQPQNVVDKSLLASCDYIVVRAFGAVSYAQLELAVRAVAAEGVPADRFVIGVQALPLDASDLATGRFADASGALTLSAVNESAKWAASPNGIFGKAGLGIYDLQNDYYNTTIIYKNTREAICVMNPAPKN